MCYRKIVNSIILYINRKLVRLRQNIIFILPYFTKTKLKEDINKAGLIGCGHIIKNLYIYALNNRNINIACKSLLSTKYRDSFFIKRNLSYQSDCYDNFELFSNSGINSIIITTPNYSHYEYIVKGIKNKFNILCEKPLTNNIKEALHIKELLKGYPVTLMVGFQIRYSPIFNNLKLLLKHKELGEIQKIYVYHFANIKDHIDNSTWLNDIKKSGGGVLFNVGIHSINLLCALLGDVATLSSRLENLILPISYGEDTAFCKLNFQREILCLLKVSYLNNANTNKQFSMNIYCEKGFINCDFHNNYIFKKDNSKKSGKYIFFDKLEHEFVYNELNRFVYYIDNKIKPETDINDSIKTLAIINQLYQYGNGEKQVRISDGQNDVDHLP